MEFLSFQNSFAELSSVSNKTMITFVFHILTCAKRADFNRYVALFKGKTAVNVLVKQMDQMRVCVFVCFTDL